MGKILYITIQLFDFQTFVNKILFKIKNCFLMRISIKLYDNLIGQC